jgi:hypothetical protein
MTNINDQYNINNQYKKCVEKGTRKKKFHYPMVATELPATQPWGTGFCAPAMMIVTEQSESDDFSGTSKSDIF